MLVTITARIFTRHLLRTYRDFSHFSKLNRCQSVILINTKLSSDWLCDRNATRYNPLSVSTRLQFYSDDKKVEETTKPSIFTRFKQMYKEYWYVLIPVHFTFSVCWFGGFYYLSKSGVDVAGILESWHVSESITSHLKESNMGHIAVSYALYKIATPVRYTVTLGGTTVSINYLRKWGYIKPVPTKERLKEMYFEKKENLRETMHETSEQLKLKSEQLKDKIEDLDKGIKKLGKKMPSKDSIVQELKKKKEVNSVKFKN